MKVKVGNEEEFINWKIVFNNLYGRFFFCRRRAPPTHGDKKLDD